MTADEARLLLPFNAIEKYVADIDSLIQQESNRGVRHCTFNKGKGNNRELADYYKGMGFVVHHYTAPFDEVELEW